MKRKLDCILTEDFIENCQREFDQDPSNIIARNAINSVGSVFATVNSKRVNELSYMFENTLKKKNLKATNQGESGRCWMFAALNIFRHILIRILDLENFEFSQTFLFFWDKFERCNSYIQWFIDHEDQNPGDRPYDHIVMDYMSDGGWWNTFANLVNKYGLVPLSAMKETVVSGYSNEMNEILKERLDACVNYLIKKRKKLSREEMIQVKNETLKDVYNTLVKFLGEPPTNFSWSYQTEDEFTNTVCDFTPHIFKEMVIPNLDMIQDFVSLSHIPSKEFPMNSKYLINYTNNVYEGDCCTLYNTDISELSKYAMKSITNGFAVWFVGDVSKSLNLYYAALDDQLDDHETVFGTVLPFTKGERITQRNIMGNHAMALVGFNTDNKGKPVNWQVENSWGYWDNETPGADGFLTMSHSWFEKYVMEIVVLKELLSRTLRKKIDCKAIEINPWDSMAPATKAGVVNRPRV